MNVRMRVCVLFTVCLLGGAGCDEGSSSSASNDTLTSGSDTSNGGECNSGDLCPGECYETGWCIEDRHSGANYIAVWASARDDIWVGDQGGIVRRGHGTEWEELPVPGDVQINALLGKSPQEVWVAGWEETEERAVVFKWDGTAWQEETALDPTDSLGFQVFLYDDVTDQLFGVGQELIFEHTDAGWLKRNDLRNGTRPARGVTTCEGEQYFAMGGLAAVRDGHMRQLGFDPNVRLERTIPLADGKVLMGGDYTLMIHDGDGSLQWSSAAFFDMSNVEDVAASGLDNVLVLTSDDEIHEWDGTDWRLVYTYPGGGGSPKASRIYTDAPGTVLLSAGNGVTRRIATLSGQDEILAGIPSGSSTLGENNAMFYRSATDFYTVSSSSLMRWQLGVDSDWVQVGQAAHDAVAFWVLESGEAWFINRTNEISHWDGVDRRSINTGIDLGSDELTAIWATESGEVWCVGPQHVLQFDGGTWIDHSDATRAINASGGQSLAVMGDDDVWVMRPPEAFFHFDGTDWTTLGPSPDLIDVTCENDQILGLGTHPLGLFSGPPEALEADSPLVDNYSASTAWMGGRDNVWVLGYADEGIERLRHFDGQQWQVAWDNPQPPPHALWGLPDGHVIMVARRDVLVRQP